jgi:hypothetical protein
MPQLPDELYALIAAILGGAAVWIYNQLRQKYSSRPELYEVEKMARVIVTAAREMHELETDAERLAWASDKLQKYLDAVGLSFVDVRAMIEFALEQVKRPTNIE